MKITLLITGLTMGGAKNQVVNLADAFASRGHKITLAYLLDPPLVRPRSGQAKVVWLGGTKSSLDMVKAYVNLIKLIKQSKPDVLHSHLFHANILARAALLLLTPAPNITFKMNLEASYVWHQRFFTRVCVSRLSYGS